MPLCCIHQAPYHKEVKQELDKYDQHPEQYVDHIALEVLTVAHVAIGEEEVSSTTPILAEQHTYATANPVREEVCQRAPGLVNDP